MVEILVFTPKHVETTRNFGAKFSECSRRKYGTLIIDDYGNSIVLAANKRIGRHCDYKSCIRDRSGIKTGDHSRVELGGEIHAEAAALIEFNPVHGENYHILIAAVGSNGELIDGNHNYPCHVCSLMIKYAGFHSIWFPFGDDVRPISIEEIIESYEQEYD